MKLQKLKYKILAIFAVVTVGVGWVSLNTTQNIYAEGEKSSIFLSPMTQKIILTPGETYTGTITVSNTSTSNTSLNYDVKIGSYTTIETKDSKDDYGGATVDERTSNNIMMDWTTIDKTEGIVPPNSNETISYTIKVPKDAPAGAQYASLLVSEKESTDSTNNSGSTSGNVKSKFQLASVIFANVAGETVEKGSISENNMPSVLTTNKLEATSMVRNDGNIYTDATYTLQVWPLTSDEELCTNEEKAETSMILPNTERYHVQTCDLPAVGIFRAKQVVKIFGEESVLEKTIFVCPVWLMILAIVIVVAIVITIVVMVRKRKKSASQD